MMNPRFLTLLLVLICLLSCVQASATAPLFSDIKGHWAETAIIRWSGIGVISGYPDGTFRPNNTVTRGELAAIINNLMGFPEVHADVGLFSDTSGKWWAGHVNTLALQGVYLVTHGEAKGDAALTREEAAAMIYNSFPVQNPSSELQFTDYDAINTGYAEKISIMQNTGFLSGYLDGTFRPKNRISRAEVLAILNSMITDYINEPGLYNALEGNRVLVVVPEVRLNCDCEYLVVAPAASGGRTFAYENVTYASLWFGEIWFAKRPIYEEWRYVYQYDTRFAGGAGMEWSPYLIGNQMQLELLDEYLGNKNKYMYFTLANDINLTGQWTPIGGKNDGSFFGAFDGNGSSVSGMNISSDFYSLKSHSTSVGLFDSISGTVCNLAVSGDISFDTSSKRMMVGGLCGYMYYAIVDNCVSHVNISVSAPNQISAGGIAGVADSSVLNACQADGDIRVVSTGYTEDEDATAGGMVGHVTGSKITDSLSSTNVTAIGGYHSSAGGLAGHIIGDSGTILKTERSTISNCYTAGQVHAEGGSFQNNAGGFSGQVKNSTVENCWSSADVSVGKNEFSINVAGGFVSGLYFGGVVKNCYATGSVNEYGIAFLPMVGSFTGRLEGSVINCYATGGTTVIDREGVEHPYNAIVGSRRGEGGTITQCIDLTANDSGKPFIINEPTGRDPVITNLTAAQTSQSNTYIALGWDFVSVWMLPDPSDLYKLPILHGAFENEQRTLTIPVHLTV